MRIEFVKSLIKESQEFFDLAREEKKNSFIREMHVKASVAFAWFGLEGFVNLLIDDFLTLKKIELHERAFLEEKRVEFDEGSFEIKGQRYYSTKDKILFLLDRFGQYKVNKSSIMWSNLSNLENLRNSLAHPKINRTVKHFELKHAEQGLSTVKSIIKMLYKKIHKKNFQV